MGSKVIHNQELMLFQRTWMNFNRLFTTKDWQKFQNSFSGCFHLFFGILMQGSGKQEDSGCYNVLEMFWSMKREKQLPKSSCKGPACAILGHSLLLDPAANVLNHHSWLLFNFEHTLYPHSFHLVLPVSFPLHPQNTVWQFLYEASSFPNVIGSVSKSVYIS